jgi:hypothetical protein
MTALEMDVRELSFDEINDVSGAYSLREYAEAGLVGLTVGAIVTGGNPAGALAGAAVAILILHM